MASVVDTASWNAPAGWPARSRADCEAVLTAPGAKFAMATVAIRGNPTRTCVNAHANQRVLPAAGRAHGEA